MIAERIKAERIKRGLTGSFVAECVGISQQAYNAIEHGLRCPSVPVAKCLSKLFNCSLDYLLANDKMNKKG